MMYMPQFPTLCRWLAAHAGKRRAVSLVLAASVVAMGSALAAEPPTTTPPPETAKTAETDSTANPCRGDLAADAERIDRLRQGVFATVCTSSHFFDGLFGDARDFSEYTRETYGRAGLAVGWNRMDGVGLDGHLRANIYLPALGDRFNAVIGRESEESFVNDNFDDMGYLPGSFSDDRDGKWYAGLNYGAVEGTNSRFDVSAGVQVKIPLNPYVKARYRYYVRPSEHLLVTTRTTGFWQNTDGFGVTLAIDSDWSIDQGRMLRWSNIFTKSEVTDGIKWKTRLAYYQALSELSAMRYEASMRGETQGIQPYLKELKLTYRRSVWRGWFFVETYGGVFWADDLDPDKRCDACAMIGVGFELMFGERYDRDGSSDQASPSADHASSLTRP
jgi:hypothetical protein